MGAADDERFRRSEAAISARLLSETVILDLDQNQYTRLNGSAGTIWEALESPRTVTELGDQLVAEYGIEAERARDDARSTVERLRDRDLVQTS